MNAGPTGFGHAPVTKGLVLGAIGSTVIANAARASHRRLPRPLVLSSQALAFKSPGELLFGCLLLYYFRVLERQTGSTKFGSYAAAVTGFSYALQLAISSLFQLKVPLAQGPLPLVFASFIPFLLDIPPTSHFTVLGFTMTDKAFVYLAGLQLLLTSGRKSLAVLVASTLAGLLYRLNFCNVKQFRLPSPVVGIFSKVLGPLLSDHSGPSIVMVGSTGPAAAAGPVGLGQAGPAGLAGLRHRAGAAAAAAGGGGGVAAGAVPGPAAAASPEALEQLIAMGFTRERALQALQQSGNDVETAIAILVSSS